jgi:8-oxo-dGTP diphosphatase
MMMSVPGRREVVRIEPSAIRDVYIFVRRGDLLLLLLRDGTGYKDGEWGPPAGRVEVGETYRGAAVRELREETGLDADSAILRLVHLLHREPDPGEMWPWVGAFFDASGVYGDPRNREPTKCRAMGWHPVDALPTPMVDYVEHVLKAVAEGVAYSEWRS